MRRVITKGKFGYGALRDSKDAVVSGGEFGCDALKDSQNAVVSGGKFGDYALWYSKDAVVSGGKFEDGALMGSQGAVVIGGIFHRNNNFVYAENLKMYIPKGAGKIREIKDVISGIIVVEDLTQVLYENVEFDPEKVRIFTPSVKGGVDYIIKINPEDIRKDVGPENIDEALEEIVKRYAA